MLSICPSHLQQRAAAGRVFEREGHEGGFLLRVIGLRIDGIRMPAVSEDVFGLHAFHVHVEENMLVALVRDGPAGALAGRELLPAKVAAEPFAELLGSGQRLPHPRARRVDLHRSFDAVGGLGRCCIGHGSSFWMSNRLVA
jgi:hypothetical protein